MADNDTASRIAKILARATSDNPNEAEASLKSAYARMKRDGVTVQDLLALPSREIYQDALVRLIDLIVQDQTELSPSSRRELYARYLQMVVSRFSGAAGEGGGGREPPRPGPKPSGPPPKQDPPRQEPPKPNGKEYWSQNSNTPNQGKGNPVRMPTGFTFPFSPAAIFSLLGRAFGRGSFLACALREPGRTFQLAAISAIFGAAASAALLLAVALAYSLFGFEPVGSVRLSMAFAFFATVGGVWKGRAMYLGGWFSY